MASKDRKNQDFSKPFENHILRYCCGKSLDELSKKDIIICLDRLYAEGKRESIKRSYSILKNMMSFALHRDYLKQSDILNINLKILYGQVKPISFRAITDIFRFKELLLAIESYQGNIFTKAALQLSPYIFLRSANMRNLKWEEVDFERKRIILPANKVKGGEEFIVPLSESAIQILKNIQFFSGSSSYVFPSDISKSKVIGENTLLQAIKRLGFGEEMVYHGFRTSASTFLYEYKNIHKYDSEVIELCLDHRERNRVKAIYNRSLRLDDRTALMQWWSDLIDRLKAEK
ncbi:tyrosine-type recombinase/integrase [Campylobacter helveticus]|uniref:tyrosine-type recombinase/integrase n=1 Tax=Campylobacter helveticus TaxID=28898 RepID=UPI002149B7EB|nr:site-specific integrase [Campylobacter helveticus]MCR2064365.1 site-specific integrase [Campylobacter helveticus]